jgi:DNA-binding MarR family transcriptional regulator
VSDYAGTGKHLTATELRLWTAILDASRIAETEIEAQLSGDFGMTHREYEVLVRIDGAGGQMRMSVLARQIECSRALVTQTVSRLVERRWLERKPSPGDRRGVEAALTALGRRKLAAAAKPHAELVRRLLLSPIDAVNLEVVADEFRSVADHLRSHRAGESCDDETCPLN